MNTQTKQVPVYLNGSHFAEKVISVPDTITERALIRRAKSAHGLGSFRHKTAQFVGVDGGDYIRLDIVGMKLSVLIDVHGGEDHE